MRGARIGSMSAQGSAYEAMEREYENAERADVDAELWGDVKQAMSDRPQWMRDMLARYPLGRGG